MAKVVPVDSEPHLEPLANANANANANTEDDDQYSVASSALNDNEQKQDTNPSSKFSSKRNEKIETDQSTFIKNRNALRDSVLKEVMEAIMPDIGAYDIDGMVARASNEQSKFTRAMKFLGLMDLDLHEAVLSGSMKHLRRSVRKVCTGKKANPAMVNQYNTDGMTPLSLAVKILNIDMVDFLLDYDALPDIVDENSGRTPIHFSVMSKAHLITQTLIQNNASVDMPDFKCVTPLMLAAANSDIAHLKLLIDKAAEVDARDENGWTPLHYAANANALKCCKYLMREGANRHLRDLQKRRALDIARFRDFGDVIALLSASRLQW